MTIEYYPEVNVSNKPFSVARNDYRVSFKARKAKDAINTLRSNSRFTGCVYYQDPWNMRVSGLLAKQISKDRAEHYFKLKKHENKPRNPRATLADQNTEEVRKLAEKLGGTLYMPRRLSGQ